MKILLAMLWGGCFGYSMARFALAGDWGMVTFTIGTMIAIIYLVIWMIDIKYD